MNILGWTVETRETAEYCIIGVYPLANNCEDGTMKEELIWDKLVVGILDEALLKKLPLMSDLTLKRRNGSSIKRGSIGTLKNAGEPGTGEGKGNASLDTHAVCFLSECTSYYIECCYSKTAWALTVEDNSTSLHGYHTYSRKSMVHNYHCERHKNILRTRHRRRSDCNR